jgi:hypothetical protein
MPKIALEGERGTDSVSQRPWIWISTEARGELGVNRSTQVALLPAALVGLTYVDSPGMTSQAAAAIASTVSWIASQVRAVSFWKQFSSRPRAPVTVPVPASVPIPDRPF